MNCLAFCLLFLSFEPVYRLLLLFVFELSIKKKEKNRRNIILGCYYWIFIELQLTIISIIDSFFFSMNCLVYKNGEKNARHVFWKPRWYLQIARLVQKKQSTTTILHLKSFKKQKKHEILACERFLESANIQHLVDWLSESLINFRKCL